MKYSKLIKKNLPEILFLALIIAFCYIYFVIYLTPSRVTWYREMRDQITIGFKGIVDIL